MTKIETEKRIISAIWSSSGIHSPPALNKGMKYNSQYFYQHVIPDIQQTICSSIRSKTLKDIVLHLGNSPTHNSRLSSENIEFSAVQRVPHPFDGPDLAPSEFFLFGYLKEKLRGTSLTASEDFILTTRQFSLKFRKWA
jgi:hypothetical protein